MNDLVKIVDEAPEGATHVDDENGYWILSANQNIKDQCYMDNKGFRDLSTFGFAFRDLSDLRRIVELESQNAELLDLASSLAKYPEGTVRGDTAYGRLLELLAKGES